MNFWATGYQRLRPEDIGTHELHIGFSSEEAHRSFPADTLCFKTDFRLSSGWERKDCYAHNLMSGA